MNEATQDGIDDACAVLFSRLMELPKGTGKDRALEKLQELIMWASFADGLLSAPDENVDLLGPG